MSDDAPTGMPDRDPLLDRLARMWQQHDPVPADLDAGVLALIDAQSVLDDAELDDAVLLELVSDQERLAGVRGGAERTLRFAAGGGRAEVVLRLVADASGTRIDGWLVPAEPGTVSLAIGDRVHDTPVDASGRFAFAGVPDGEASLRWSGTTAGSQAEPDAAPGRTWTTADFTI